VAAQDGPILWSSLCGKSLGDKIVRLAGVQMRNVYVVDAILGEGM
jgi:hypothetical protein